MLICAKAMIRFAERHAEKARELAARESEPAAQGRAGAHRRGLLARPRPRPARLLGGPAILLVRAPGRDHRDESVGLLLPGPAGPAPVPVLQEGPRRRDAIDRPGQELLQCFWIKFNNQPAPPKVGVTAAESGTYTDFAQINSGGMKEDGSDGVNEVTYLVLDVIEEMRLVQPSSSIQVSKKNPDRFIKRAARIIRTGFGQPSVFNCDLIVQELIRMGKSVADARNGGSSGCVEVGAFGKEAYILTGYFNLPKVLEMTLNNGIDPRTGKTDRPGNRRSRRSSGHSSSSSRPTPATQLLHRRQGARQQCHRAAVRDVHARPVPVDPDR